MNIDYIAGFFDGEGCFTVSLSVKKGVHKFIFHVNPRITIGVSNASSSVLERMQAFLNMGHVYHHTRSKRSKSGRIKKEAVFRIYRRDHLKQFTKLIENKIIVKKRELNLFKKVLDLAESPTQNIKEIVQIAEKLNPRSTSPRKWTVQEIEKCI